MIFIKWNENNEVTYMHYMPFHREHGLNKTQEELLREGALVDEIPTIECPNDKMIVHKYNKENNTVYCELTDKILTEEKIKENQITALQQSQDIQDRVIIESDMRLMEVEIQLEYVLNTTMKLSSVDNSIFEILDRMVKNNNYTTREYMMDCINKYYSRGRLTAENKLRLEELLQSQV